MATLVLHIIREVIHHGADRLVPASAPRAPARTAATSRGADGRRPPVCDTRTTKRRAPHWPADVVIGGIIGGVVAVNVVIYSGIEPGYQASFPEVFRQNAFVGLVTVIILMGGPVAGVLVARWLRRRG